MTQQGQQQQQVRLPPHAQLQTLQAVLSSSSQINTGRTPNDILQELVGLSREYLDIVPSTSRTPTEESIKALLRLLIGLATEQIRARDPDGFAPLGSLAGAQSPQPQQQLSTSTPLLPYLLRSVGQPQVEQSVAAPGPNLLLQQLQQQHLSPRTAQLTGQQLNLQNILAQGAGSSSLSGTPLYTQLLLQLQRQAGGAGDVSQASPPGDNCRTS
jgi:hypothetical protein